MKDYLIYHVKEIVEAIILICLLTFVTLILGGI